MDSTAAPLTLWHRLCWTAALLAAAFLLLPPLAHAQTVAQGATPSVVPNAAISTPSTPLRAPDIALTLTSDQDLSLRPQWQYFYTQEKTIDPSAIWNLPASAFKTGDDAARMSLDENTHYVARFHIQESRSDFSFYLAVPVPHLDRVRLWYRLAGSSEWRAFVAGDIVPNEKWPFIGPYPAFELPGRHQGMDVVMSFDNQSPLFVRAYTQTSQLFHSERNLYSNGTGGSLGLIGAVVLICLLTFITRRPEFFWLAATGLATFFFYIARSGVGYISFWPNFAGFNDISMLFFGCLASAGMAMVVSFLIPNFKGVAATRYFYWGFAALGGLFAILQTTVLSASAGLIIFSVYALIALLICFAFPLFMAFARGDRVSTWVSVALIGVMACTATQIYSFYLATPVDAWGIISSVGWTFAALGLFGAAFGKFQYGHTALGEQINFKDELDNLTGLLNAKGFEQSMSLTVLAAGQKRDLAPVITLMMCRLPSVERQEFDSYGKTASNQAEIRLAAAIKHALPETAVVARVQRGCLVIFLTDRVTAKSIEAGATKIISDVLNAEDLPNFVSELGLQILIGQVPSHRLSTGVFQALHAYGEAHEYENKTIHWVELSTTTKPVR